MFNPSRDQARQFFIEAWRKARSGALLTPLEGIAAELLAMHPEYHALLEHPDALVREWPPGSTETNPFLHLSLHLAVGEQLSIDQPPGIRAAFESLMNKRGERHAALHAVMECLEETLRQAQKSQSAPDGAAYVELIRRGAG